MRPRDGKLWTRASLTRLYEVTQAVMFLPNVSRGSVQSLWTPNSFVIHAGLVDPDDAPDLPDEPTVHLGELYALGDHRLLCGDATDPADVRRVFGEATEADLMWTDPPYGVAYQTKLSTEEAVARHRRTDGLEVANDQPEDIPALLAAAFGEAPLGPAARSTSPHPRAAMSCRPSTPPWPVPGCRSASSCSGSRTCSSWAATTTTTATSRSCTAGRRVRPTSSAADGRRTRSGRSRPRRSETHPTMKPVELVARALSNSSRPGDLVYEPFAGSGSTIIAAEQTRRRCVALEIDPRYAQVAIERWQAFTGRTAELVDG